jgi:hypothetical protein
VEFSVKVFRIEIRLAFDENWKPLLDGLRQFLAHRSIGSGKVRSKGKSRTWHLVVSRRRSVLRMAKAMLPHVVKKRKELIAVISYMEGNNTGRDFVDAMNRAVKLGERVGKIREGGPDFTHASGVRTSRFVGESRRRSVRTTLVDPGISQAILRDRNLCGYKFEELEAKYGYSRWILRRVIRDLSKGGRYQTKKSIRSEKRRAPLVGR